MSNPEFDHLTEERIREHLSINDFPFGPVSPIVGNPSPLFTAPAVMPDNSIDNKFNLKSYAQGSYALIFFYPADFTFVCPTEIIAYNNKIKEFEKRNVKIIGISVDSVHSHLAWKNTPIDKGGIGSLEFPLVSDINKNISQSFRVSNSDGVALRASFLIDKNGIIRHLTVNDLSIGRSVDETLRIIDALQFTEKHGEVCPANWHKGEEAMPATTDGVAQYLKKNSKKL